MRAGCGWGQGGRRKPGTAASVRTGGRRGEFVSAARYANGLSKRVAVRRALTAGARAVLLFEDDAVFAPDFRERATGIRLPDDWGIFYFGCLHVSRPTAAGEGLVRVARAVDSHAIAVRAAYVREVIRATAPWGHRGAGRLRHSEVLISDLNARIPTYAAWPNLVWQDRGLSDITGLANGNYSETGEQLWKADQAIPLPEGGCARAIEVSFS